MFTTRRHVNRIDFMKTPQFKLGQALSKINEEKTGNSFLLLGPDFVSKRIIVKSIEEKLTDPAGRSFDRTVIWGDEKDACDRFIENAWSLPVFSKSKVLIVYNTDQLKLKKDIADINNLFDFPETTCVVFITDSGDSKKFLSSRKCPSLLKEISRFAETFMFLDPYPNERRSFISELEKIYDVKLTPRQNAIIESNGPESAAGLHQVFEIIGSGILNGTGIDIEDVLVRKDTLESVSYAVGRKKLGEALVNLEKTLKWGHKSSDLINVLSKHFSVLKAVRMCSEKNPIPSNGFALQNYLLTEFGLYISPENAPEYIKQAKLWKDEEIGKAREILFCKTKDIRSGGSDLFLSLSVLIGDIININI